MSHPSDDDLERCLLRQIREEAALAALKEHLLVCPACVDWAEVMAD